MRSTLLSASLLTATQPLNISGTRGFSFHVKILRSPCSRARFTQERGFQSSLLPPSLQWRSQGLCCSLGVCLYTACLSQPLSHLHSHSLPDGRLQPSLCLVSPFPPGIPHTQPLSRAPNPLWESCSLLTVGKAPWASFFPYLLVGRLRASHAMRLEMQHMSWDLWWLCISSEIDLKTIRNVKTMRWSKTQERCKMVLWWLEYNTGISEQIALKILSFLNVKFPRNSQPPCTPTSSLITLLLLWERWFYWANPVTSLWLLLSGTKENNHTCLKTRQQVLQNQEAVSEITINMQIKVGFPNFLDLDS